MGINLQHVIASLKLFTARACITVSNSLVEKQPAISALDSILLLLLLHGHLPARAREYEEFGCEA